MSRVFQGAIVSSFKNLLFNSRYVFVTDKAVPSVWEFDGSRYQRVCNLGNFTFIDSSGNQIIEGNSNYWYMYPKTFLRERRNQIRNPFREESGNDPVVVNSNIGYYSLFTYDAQDIPTTITINTETSSADQMFELTAGNLIGDGTVVVDDVSSVLLAGGAWLIDLNFTLTVVENSGTSDVYVNVVSGANGSSQPINYVSRNLGQQRVLFRCESNEPFSITPRFTINKSDTTGTLTVQYQPEQVQIMFTKLS